MYNLISYDLHSALGHHAFCLDVSVCPNSSANMFSTKFGHLQININQFFYFYFLRGKSKLNCLQMLYVVRNTHIQFGWSYFVQITYI